MRSGQKKARCEFAGEDPKRAKIFARKLTTVNILYATSALALTVLFDFCPLDFEGDVFPALDLLSMPCAVRRQDARISDVIFMVHYYHAAANSKLCAAESRRPPFDSVRQPPALPGYVTR